MPVDETRTTQLKELSLRLGYTFRDIKLLNKALTHRSYSNECNNPIILDNERFEFLGDSALDLIVSRYIVLNGRRLREGDLSRIRSQLVNEQSLAVMARELGLGEFLLLGRGEEVSGGRDKNSLLANAFEAVVAAIFLDSSFDTTYQVLLLIMKNVIDDTVINGKVGDHKGRLQTFINSKGLPPVSYKLVDESGPDHKKTFTIQVWVENKPHGAGTGRTKKEAEQEAAKMTLESLASTYS